MNNANVRKLVLRFVLLIAVVAVALHAQTKPAADLIITHANIWTVDAANPTGQAVAVLRDRIVAVGTDADIDAWRGVKTRVIDAAGKLVLPGFNDAHCHFLSGGLQLDAVDLKDATSAQEFARRIGERAKITPKGEWIVAGNWDETKWTPAEFPSKELIDPLTREVRVFVSRYDGHMGLANSAALRAAGITAQTADPPGGVILRDAHGNPTGELKDAAQDLMLKAIPSLTTEQRVHLGERALAHAASLGVTSCQNMDNGDNQTYNDLEAFSRLLEHGKLTMRLYVAPSIVDWEDQAKIGVRHAFGGSFLRIGALKGYADGSLGARTAYFFEPFIDTPGNHGLLSEQMQPPLTMRDRMLKADTAGLQLCTHAIGDQGISMILDFYADIVKAHGPADRRFRIEHAQHMAAKDFDRFAQLGVIASMQPYHAIDDGRWAEKRIGHDRASRTYAFRTFLDHGVRLAFGTDWPVAPLNPMLGLYAAVMRSTLDGKNPNGWFPEQKLTVAEAVYAYTMGSAYAEFQENEKGSISVGKLADMVILSDDIFTVDPVKIREVKVLKTLVGGKVVWDADSRR
jgi:predicted amidohydrolase YtcJ